VSAISIDQAVAILEQTGIEPTARPEVVSPGEFATLFRLLRETPT